MRKRTWAGLIAGIAAVVLALTGCNASDGGSSDGNVAGGFVTVNGKVTCSSGSARIKSVMDPPHNGTKWIQFTKLGLGGTFTLVINPNHVVYEVKVRCGDGNTITGTYGGTKPVIKCTQTACTGPKADPADSGYDTVTGTIVCVGGAKPTGFGVEKVRGTNNIRNKSYNKGQFSFEINNADQGYVPKFTGCGSRGWTKASQSFKDTKIALVCSAKTACQKAGPKKIEQAGRVTCLTGKKRSGHPDRVWATNNKTGRGATTKYTKSTGRYTVTMKNYRDGYVLNVIGCGGSGTKATPMYSGYFEITCGRPYSAFSRIGHRLYKTWRC